MVERLVVEQLVECVANVSEGRDAAVIVRLEAAIHETPGVRLLDRQTDPDHNRTVLTFAGAPGPVEEAAVTLAGRAAELIDLNRHRGVHPRIGALDVLPFVPLAGVTLADCAALAERAGARIWEQHRIPVYFYGAAARLPGRRNLAEIRRGQFEGLRVAARENPESRPDIGGPELHPTAGAVAIGARKVMIAYNILLDSSDPGLARSIARKIRQSSGGLPHVLAMGVLLASRNLAQVSMNLTDYEVTPPHVVFEAVRREAMAAGTDILASEIIGLIPQRALDMAAGIDLRWENLTVASVLERAVSPGPESAKRKADS